MILSTVIIISLSSRAFHFITEPQRNVKISVAENVNSNEYDSSETLFHSIIIQNEMFKCGCFFHHGVTEKIGIVGFLKVHREIR